MPDILTPDSIELSTHRLKRQLNRKQAMPKNAVSNQVIQTRHFVTLAGKALNEFGKNSLCFNKGVQVEQEPLRITGSVKRHNQRREPKSLPFPFFVPFIGLPFRNYKRKSIGNSPSHVLKRYSDVPGGDPDPSFPIFLLTSKGKKNRQEGSDGREPPSYCGNCSPIQSAVFPRKAGHHDFSNQHPCSLDRGGGILSCRRVSRGQS